MIKPRRGWQGTGTAVSFFLCFAMVCITIILSLAVHATYADPNEAADTKVLAFATTAVCWGVTGLVLWDLVDEIIRSKRGSR